MSVDSVWMKMLVVCSLTVTNLSAPVLLGSVVIEMFYYIELLQCRIYISGYTIAYSTLPIGTWSPCNETHH